MKYLETIGEGTFGVVCMAFDPVKSRCVAIKRIPDIYTKADMTKRAMRELCLMHLLRHENIVTLHSTKASKKNLFLIMEHMEGDLHMLTYSNNYPNTWPCELLRTKSDYTSVLFQILNAVNFLHASNVIHRDIKPGNILVDFHLRVKLCDFGFATVLNSHEECEDAVMLTEYMVTRWYRAPEIVLNPRRYGKAQDIWSVACTFAELLIKRPLFRGKDTIDQIVVIVGMLPKLSEEDLNFPMRFRSKEFVCRQEHSPNSLSFTLRKMDKIHPELFSLVRQMLQFNPHRRITAEDARMSPVFDKLRSAATETAPSPPLESRLEECAGFNDLYKTLTKTERYDNVQSIVDAIDKELNPVVEGREVCVPAECDGDEILGGIGQRTLSDVPDLSRVHDSNLETAQSDTSSTCAISSATTSPEVREKVTPSRSLPSRLVSAFQSMIRGKWRKGKTVKMNDVASVSSDVSGRSGVSDSASSTGSNIFKMSVTSSDFEGADSSGKSLESSDHSLDINEFVDTKMVLSRMPSHRDVLDALETDLDPTDHSCNLLLERDGTGGESAAQPIHSLLVNSANPFRSHK